MKSTHLTWKPNTLVWENSTRAWLWVLGSSGIFRLTLMDPTRDPDSDPQRTKWMPEIQRSSPCVYPLPNRHLVRYTSDMETLSQWSLLRYPIARVPKANLDCWVSTRITSRSRQYPTHVDLRFHACKRGVIQKPLRQGACYYLTSRTRLRTSTWWYVGVWISYVDRTRQQKKTS